MKKFLATILTLCALVCCAVGLSACGDDGNYAKGPNATARPNVTTVADEAEWEKLLSLRDSYPCTITRIYTEVDALTIIYTYNGTAINITYSYATQQTTQQSPGVFYEKVDDNSCYEYYPNELGIYKKDLISSSDFDPFYVVMNNVCSEYFKYSDFTYNESTLRYENGDNYVKFVDGRLSEAYYSNSYQAITFKVTYGKVDITLPQV